MSADLVGIDHLPQNWPTQELARRHLRHFAPYVMPNYVVNPFGTRLADVCEQFIEDCIAGLSPRVMIEAPPQHGKSLFVSRLLPAWAYGSYPHLRFVGASYGDTLALEMSRDVQAIMDSEEYQELFPSVRIPAKGGGEGRRSDEAWRILAHDLADDGSVILESDGMPRFSLRGAYRARGVGQGLSGFPADPLIIDDPFKSLKDANSAAMRRDVWDWYSAVGLLRVQPGSGVMVMSTRWHVDDLAGRLIQKQKEGLGLPWKVVSYPAVAVEDEDFRKEGEALCPHRYDLKSLRATQETIGPFVWAALFQQRPTVAGGDIFEDEWWRYHTPQTIPRIEYRLIFADTAQKTKEKNDFSVMQCWGFGADKKIYLLDQDRGKWKAPELLRHATAFWDKWNFVGKDHEVTRAFHIEDKVSGTGLIQQLQSGDTMGDHGTIPVVAIQRNVDKVIRADDAAPQIHLGNVVIPERAEWLMEYKAEFSSFTRELTHQYDDQVDPTCDAIKTMLVGGRNTLSGAIF